LNGRLPDAYFDRFAARKYRNAHPVQRALLRRFISVLRDLALSGGPLTSVLEVGIGEGFISGLLSSELQDARFAGIDASANNVERVRRLFPEIEVAQGSAYDLTSRPRGCDLVICAEVLEHLETPTLALEQIRLLRPKRVLLSVPHEPFFMLGNLARLQNVTRLGNDPEHVNHWGRRSFRTLITPYFDVIRLTTSFPWILALATPR
jgi:2-polyprenyl-3-methyl-5-hydroxy-6-metoxy-1,4-benzoquinol methylase